MDKKRLAELGLAIFVAIIFISSYVSLTNYNSATATTTIPATAYAHSYATAVITGYSNPLYMNVACHGDASLENLATNSVTASLTALEANSSILDFIPSGTNISIASENMSTYGIYTYVTGRLDAQEAQCIHSYAIAHLLLPPLLNVTVGSQALQVQLTTAQMNQSIYTALNKSLGTKVKVKVSMLLTQNGSIYGPMSILLVGPVPATSATVKTTTVIPPNTISSNAITSNSIPVSNAIAQPKSSNIGQSNPASANNIQPNGSG